MKTRNKKISIIVASALFVSPLLTSADMSVWTDESTNMINWTSSNMYIWWSKDFNETASWRINIDSEQKAKFEAQKEKLGSIMKSLESDLKYIRENLTKENSEELKKKIEELKNSYIEKIATVQDNKEEAKKIIEHRFQIFIKTQIENKDRLKDMKEKIEKMKDKALDKAKEMKAKMEEHKENKLVEKYKAKFVKQLQNKLDNIPTEKLQGIITKVEAKRKIIADSTKLKAVTKEKYLAQLDALLEILKEKLNPSEEELDINQIIDEATGTGWTIDNSWSTVTQ